MRSSRTVLIVLMLVGVAEAASPWVLPEWKYRAPVQVVDSGATAVKVAALAIADVPSTLLISQGKLAQSGADLRLVDEKGNSVPLRAEQLLSDTGDARLVFVLDHVPAHGRRILWMYYGNPLAQAGPTLDSAKSPGETTDVTVSVGAEESAQPSGVVQEVSLDKWLSTHRLIEMQPENRPASATRRADGSPRSRARKSGGSGAENLRSRIGADIDVKQGQYVCWVRYLSAQPGQTPQGALNLSLQRSGLAPATRTAACEGPASYRWASIPITVPSDDKVHLTADAEGSSAALDRAVLTTDLKYRPDIRDFEGLVWARWRIDRPEGYRYCGGIESEIDPYKPSFLATGTVTPLGLRPPGGAAFQADEDYFRTGEYSPWVLLPTSGSRQWHSVLFFAPKDSGKVDPAMTVRLEFANRPSSERVFHITPAEPIEMEKASLGVRMPTTTTLEGLRQLETFEEWSKRRLALVENLNLSPPPRLKRLKVGTWVSLSTRVGQGKAGKEMADLTYRVLESLGVNMPSVYGIDDAVAGEMLKKHGMIGTTWTAWAANGDVVNNFDGQFAFKDGETPVQRWQRLLEDMYRNNADRAKKEQPNLFNASVHVNLGDEIGQIANATILVRTPQGMVYFHDWLKRHGQTPEDLGAKSWGEVKPLGDRNGIANEEGTPKARLFYWTRQFINDCSAQYYRCATIAAKKYFPKAEIIAVNYQAAPMGAAFIGNGNDMDNETLDFFHFGRVGAFDGVMMEDWVDGCDLGVGAENLAAEMMRAAARKHNSPLACYLVGGEAMRGEFYGFLMHGIKEIGLYLYGPISNIGPAWGEDPRALKELAEVTREVKEFEDAIADGVIPPRKAALLVATTSDYMQNRGIRFCGERQTLYVALQHAYLPLNVVCEEDIVEDNILKNYDLLYVTDPQVREDAQRKIAEWVKTGGKLWACVGAANWNEYNTPSSILNEVFGVSRRKMLTQEDCLPAEQTQAPGAKNKWAYNLQVGTIKADSPMFGGEAQIQVWGYRLDAEPTTAQPIGKYDDGKPAMLLNTYGKGQVLLVGAMVGRSYAHDHWPQGKKEGKGDWSFDLGASARKIAAGLAAGIARPVTLSLPGIYASVMDSPQGTLVFLNNATLCGETDLTGAIHPEVTVSVPVTGKVGSVESAKLGKRNFTVKNGVLSFDLPLPNADVILLRK
jgi:hypothetical protein